MWPCRLCLDGQSPDAGSIEATILEYIRLLPEHLRAPEAVYAARLARCEACSHRMGLTCMLCGCYVQTRAAKLGMRCPDADGPGWA